MQESVQEKFDVSQDWIHQEGKLGRELAVHGETYTSWVPMDARSDDHLGDWWRAYPLLSLTSKVAGRFGWPSCSADLEA